MDKARDGEGLSIRLFSRMGGADDSERRRTKHGDRSVLIKRGKRGVEKDKDPN